VKKTLYYILTVTIFSASTLLMAGVATAKSPCAGENDSIRNNKPAFMYSRKGIGFFCKELKHAGIIPWYAFNDRNKRKGVGRKKIAYAIEAIVKTQGFRSSGITSLTPAVRRTLEIYLHALAND